MTIFTVSVMDMMQTAPGLIARGFLLPSVTENKVSFLHLTP